MEAPQLIGDASYTPDTLNILYKAFDRAWESIVGNYDNPLAIEAARMKLANIILNLPNDDSKDPEQIKNAALRLMALDD